MVAIHLIIFSKVDRIKHHKREYKVEYEPNTMITAETKTNRQAEQTEQQQRTITLTILKNKIGNQSIF